MTAQVSALKAKFAKRFGVDQADAIEHAAEFHENGINSEKKGSDAFRWALTIAIGYQCFEVDRYRKYHGITADYEAIRRWIKRNAKLAEHDGDCDYLALFCGTYNQYMPKQKRASQPDKISKDQ